MPTTPRFHVTQDTNWVLVHVNVPYVRVSEMEFYVDGHQFTFYCKPYLLKLQFSHEIVDDELAKAVYDPNKDNGTIVVHLPKKEPGQEFEDLDMLTKLLQPKVPKIDVKLEAQRKSPLIEVLSSSDTPTTIINDEEHTDQQKTQAKPTQTNSTLLDLENSFAAAVKEDEEEGVRITDLQPHYGFNDAYSDFFRCWHGEVTEIISLPEPEIIPADQRRVLREATEEQQFDVERYLLDFANAKDDMYFDLAMQYEGFWKAHPVISIGSERKQQVQQKKPLIMEVIPTSEKTMDAMTDQLQQLDLDNAERASVIFSDADQELLRRLPNKEYLIPRGSNEEQVVMGGLVDILIGFTYDHLTTQGDSGVESTWTISILSPTLSWLDSTSDLRAVVRTAVRRMLTFPFLRQYQLAMHVLHETCEILKRGKRVILRALLQLYRIVEKSETQYLLNTLYIQDYCVWIQSVSDEQVLQWSSEFEKAIKAFTKAETGWALEVMEQTLFEVDEDEEPSEEESSEEESSSSEEESSSDEEDTFIDDNKATQ